MYYDEYITKKADRFPIDKASFTFFKNEENDEGYIIGTERGAFDASDSVKERYFTGVMREMVSYLFDRRNEAREEHDGDVSLELLFDPENVDVIYISQKEFEAPAVVVEYHETPEWFTMENAALRQFYWHPNPAMSGEIEGAWFQPREGF